MRLNTTHAEGTRRSLGNRLVLGFAGIMMALAMSVGFGGSANALSSQASAMPTNKAQCRNGGWKTFKDGHGKRLFKNQGRCIAAVVAPPMPGPGAGYGNGCAPNSCNVNIDINIDVIVIGNGNTIIIGFPPMMG
jgi:hypothetical protein